MLPNIPKVTSKPPSLETALKQMDDACYRLWSAVQHAHAMVHYKADEDVLQQAFDEMANRLDAQAEATERLTAAMEAA